MKTRTAAVRITQYTSGTGRPYYQYEYEIGHVRRPAVSQFSTLEGLCSVLADVLREEMDFFTRTTEPRLEPVVVDKTDA